MSFRWFQFGFLIFVLGIQSRLTLQNTGSVSADRHAAPEEESSKEQIIHLIHEEDQRRPHGAHHAYPRNGHQHSHRAGDRSDQKQDGLFSFVRIPK